ncbi:MAG: hypothetical protein ABIT38_05645, partial [Gemmatimonadaceae bacterium]
FTLAGVVVLLAVAHTGFARVLPTSNSAMQGPLISGGFRAYRWMLSYLAFTAVLVPLFYPFMRRLPTATRRDFLLSSGSYVAANFVSEALERLPMPSGVLVSLAIAMIAVAARAIVLLAIAYFVAAIVSHIEARGRSLEFRISLPNVREADREVPLPPWQQADRERRSEPREIRQ